MIVEYKTIYADYKEKIVYEYRFISISFCCDEMKRAWNEYFIRFGYSEGEYCKAEYKDSGNMCNEVCIYECNVYTCDAVSYIWMPIRYCPFCAEKIEVLEKERWELKKVTKTIPAREETFYEEVSISESSGDV
ncbi:MAG: hypothetical protein ACE5J9_06450 [Methanosarcinales archaeon]